MLPPKNKNENPNTEQRHLKEKRPLEVRYMPVESELYLPSLGRVLPPSAARPQRM